MKKIIKPLLSILGISALIVVLVFLLVQIVGSYYWQVGYTPLEWAESGLKELEQNNKLPNYDEYKIKFIKVEYEEDNYNFIYEIDFYEYTDTESVNDIDLWYGNCQTYTFYIGLERSKCLYNKMQYFISSKSGLVNCKFEKCLDFDIFIEVEENEKCKMGIR